MKTKLLIGFFAIGLLGFNLSIVTEKSSENESWTLKNVSLVQANAGEMYCNQENTIVCTITAPSGHIGQSSGKLICEF
jgi:hypothetical protein